MYVAEDRKDELPMNAESVGKQYESQCCNQGLSLGFCGAKADK